MSAARPWPEAVPLVLGDPRRIAAGIGLYVLLHAAVRFALSPTLGFDDAEQALFAQSLEGGYGLRQPPLYTWLVLAAEALLGGLPAALALVRAMAQLLCLLFLYLAARRLAPDAPTAALALLSYSFLYVLAVYAHHDLTHSTLLAAAVAASLHLYFRAVERGGALDFALLGAAAGAGLLAKYSFAVFALAGLAAALSVPAARRRVLRLAALPAPLVALLVAAPHLAWLAGQSFDPLAAADGIVRPEAAAGGLGAAGLVAFKAAEYLASFAVVAGIAMPALFRLRAGSPGGPFGHGPVLARTLALGLLGILVLAVLLDAGHVKARWFHVPLLLVPLWLFARLGARPPWPQARNLLLAAAAALLLAAAARFAVDALAPARCGACRAYLPAAALAERLRAAGFPGGTILSPDHDLAGNLLASFPGSRAFAVRNRGQRGRRPAADGGCVAVWRGGPAAMAAAFAGLPERAPPPGAVAGSVPLALPLVGAPERRVEVSYVLLPQDSAPCR